MLVRFTLAVNGRELASYNPLDISLNLVPDLLSGLLEAMENHNLRTDP